MNTNTLITQVKNPVLKNSMQTLSPIQFFDGLFASGLNIIVVVGGVFFMFYFLYGGLKWISSKGDKTALEEARGTLIHAILGLIILFSTWAIAKFIEQVFGIKILQIDTSGLVISP